MDEIIWYKFKMINLSNLSIFWQSVLHFAWILVCVGVAAVLNYLVTGLSNGSITLPIPQTLVPLVGLAIGELDSLFVQYEKTVVPQ
jgi:hypothetical protein